MLLVSVVVLAASASAPRRHAFEKSLTTPAGYDATWAAVVDVFGENNWAIANLEKDSGIITTDWMRLDGEGGQADCGDSGLAIEHGREVRFNVLVRGDDETAEVTVNTTLREYRSFDGRSFYADCTSTGVIEGRIHAMVDHALARRPSRRPPARRARHDRGSAAGTDEPAASVDEPAAGTEGGPCYGNDTCNADLTCDEDARCVAPVR